MLMRYRAKALVSALDGVNIEEAIAKAAFAAPAAAAPAAAAAAPAEAEKPKVDEKAKEKAEESGMERPRSLVRLRRIHILLKFFFFCFQSIGFFPFYLTTNQFAVIAISFNIQGHLLLEWQKIKSPQMKSC